jgi:hypothetical protein
MHYFTSVSDSERVRGGQLPGSIPVMNAPGSDVQVGIALEVSETAQGAALWMLCVNGADLPGRWTLTDGRFQQKLSSRRIASERLDEV